MEVNFSKNEAFCFFVNFSTVHAIFPTNVVSFSKLDPRLSFTRNRFKSYAFNVEQEPIKVVKLIFEHPVCQLGKNYGIRNSKNSYLA